MHELLWNNLWIRKSYLIDRNFEIFMFALQNRANLAAGGVHR